MAISNPSSVVSFDGDAVRGAVEARVEGTLRSLVEYDRDAFNPLYVDDVTLSFYEDEEQMTAHFERLHSYIHLDVTEMDLFTDELFPVADRVRYLTTAFDLFTLVRVYVDDEGMFMALDPDEPVEPLVHAIEDVVLEQSADDPRPSDD